MQRFRDHRSIIALYDTAKNERIGLTAAPFSRTSALAFSLDGELLATGHGDGQACLWRTAALLDRSSSMDALQSKKQLHANAIYDITFSPDRELAYSVAADGVFKAWPVAEEYPTSVPGHDVHRPLVSDDGRRLAVGTRQGPILVWDDFRKSTSRRTLRGHQRYVWDICFSPDDQRVASAACDGSVRLWNVNTGNELLFSRQPLTGITRSRFPTTARRLRLAAARGSQPAPSSLCEPTDSRT